jgi:hypothetical protein
MEGGLPEVRQDQSLSRFLSSLQILVYWLTMLLFVRLVFLAWSKVRIACVIIFPQSSIFYDVIGRVS